jgi:branched-chain amino acid transport system permease protein
MTEMTPLSAVSLTRGISASRQWRVLPMIEIAVLVIGLLLPLVLQDYLTVYATRVLILCLFALSFDLVWGYAGIMSFGQAVFFGSAGYGVALLARDLGITSILLVLPAGLLIGFAFALLLGGFLLLGRHPASVIFVALGTLTGSYACDRSGAGVVLSRRPERHSLDPADDNRQL